MQEKSHPYETVHLIRVGATQWSIEGRSPTPLELVAIVERVHAAGGTVLYGNFDPPLDVVRACGWVAELTAQLIRMRTARFATLRTEAAIDAGGACAEYLEALGLFRQIDVFEALPGDALAIRDVRMREQLVEGFARVTRVSIDPDPRDREANFRVLAAYAEQEEFVQGFRAYATRCWEERQRWISRSVAGCEREAERLKASGFTRERFGQALEELLNETSPQADQADAGERTSACRELKAEMESPETRAVLEAPPDPLSAVNPTGEQS
jgi:hypothetical protein